MSERKTLTGGDWIAVGTFLLGALVAVLMGLALLRGVDDAQGTGALAAGIAASIGALPALLAGVGIAWLGARAFLTGSRMRIGSEFLGVLGIAAGLSVVMGSLWPEAGGALGAWTGGRVAQMTHAAVGVLLGAIVAFGAAYLAWMREDTAAATRLAPPRRPTPAPPKSDDGVTVAESAMLFPDDDELSPPQPITVVAPARPLYPEDVRLKGQVPSGAKPLTGARATVPSAEPQPSVYRWTAPSAAAAAPSAAAAAPSAAAAAPSAAAAAPSAAAAAPSATAAAPAARATTPLAVEPARTQAVEAPAEQAVEAFVARQDFTAVEEVVDEPEVRALPPRPSWETTGLTEDDEPVDAYGTPVSVVERARRDRDVPEASPARYAAIPREVDAPELDEEPEEPAASTFDDDVMEVVVVVEIEAEPVVNGRMLPVEQEMASTLDAEMDALEELVTSDVEAPSARTVDTEAGPDEEEDALEESMSIDGPATSTAPAELQPYLSQQDELLEDLRAHNTAARNLRDAGEEAAAVVEEEEFAQAEAEIEAVASGADFQDGDVDEIEEELEVELAEVELAEVELAEVELAEVELAEVELAEPRRPELAHVGQPVPDTDGRSARSRTAAPSLFDTLEEAEEEPVQREVILQPQAAVPAARAEKSPGRGIDPEKKLLVEVGCMFVERGRVAVSMLQRQYDMDFEQACRVLDDLQEMGLIGPYLGGQRRDILLSRDQWLEKVGTG